MNQTIKNIFIGFGSVMAITPNTAISKIQLPLLQKSDAQNLAGDWQKVGQDMHLAMGQIDNEQKD